MDRNWDVAAPRDGEVMRWESLGGKWVTVARGRGASAGTVLVEDWRGRCESVEDTDAALTLVRNWQS